DALNQVVLLDHGHAARSSGSGNIRGGLALARGHDAKPGKARRQVRPTRKKARQYSAHPGSVHLQVVWTKVDCQGAGFLRRRLAVARASA
ncbi:hypothetical protein, partial [Pseudomonas alabamensis]|uniref:hypothetical protein n=1 Tax=Pseudomonas alabamensis TaxID=3064349 RepID=UPI003F64FE7A